VFLPQNLGRHERRQDRPDGNREAEQDVEDDGYPQQLRPIEERNGDHEAGHKQEIALQYPNPVGEPTREDLAEDEDAHLQGQ